MSKIFISNRKETIIIESENVAYVEADGNYVLVTCLFDLKFHLNYSISDFLDLLTNSTCEKSSFWKVDRSLVVNIDLISRVIPQKGYLLLSNGQTWSCRLELPQKTLKRLCVQLSKRFSSNNEHEISEG